MEKRSWSISDTQGMSPAKIVHLCRTFMVAKQARLLPCAELCYPCTNANPLFSLPRKASKQMEVCNLVCPQTYCLLRVTPHYPRRKCECWWHIGWRDPMYFCHFECGWAPECPGALQQTSPCGPSPSSRLGRWCNNRC